MMYPGRQRILIIDSDAKRRRLSERVLGEEGFAVTAVAEGLSAIRAADRSRFALAIAAMGLPGMLDGLTTVRRLRARQPWLRALFTGDAAQRTQRPGDDFAEFIGAPFDHRDLLGCVFELLQREVSDEHGGRRDRSRAG